MSADFVRDMARATKILQKVATGEMSLFDALTGRSGDPVPAAPIAGEGEARCEKTAGCACVVDHAGDCVIDVQVEDSSK